MYSVPTTTATMRRPVKGIRPSVVVCAPEAGKQDHDANEQEGPG